MIDALQFGQYKKTSYLCVINNSWYEKRCILGFIKVHIDIFCRIWTYDRDIRPR